ncbi:hypothetical protein BT96DRAFT_936895 [Gymnopus androsaceus JB14]|uniref:Uncharacterized protein n=1 Tax=Gymnopus androsaceus JB14 TaxID=1447944 RepID=A0A6A4HXU3_9AGAR|nr:hypothetical protein BT96DRAFT_936895 [Gymnopus androsaceus JB14]
MPKPGDLTMNKRRSGRKNYALFYGEYERLQARRTQSLGLVLRSKFKDRTRNLKGLAKVGEAMHFTWTAVRLMSTVPVSEVEIQMAMLQAQLSLTTSNPNLERRKPFLPVGQQYSREQNESPFEGVHHVTRSKYELRFGCYA